MSEIAMFHQPAQVIFYNCDADAWMKCNLISDSYGGAR